MERKRITRVACFAIAPAIVACIGGIGFLNLSSTVEKQFVKQYNLIVSTFMPTKDLAVSEVKRELRPYLHGPKRKNDSVVFDKACPRFYAKDSTVDSRLELFLAVQDASKQYSLKDELVLAVIAVESRCERFARSQAGALGLMQLMPKTAKWLGVEDPYSVRENILGGSKYLSMLLSRFDGNMEMALAAYNVGPVHVERHGKVPDILETRKFVSQVLHYYRSLIAHNELQPKGDSNVALDKA